MKLPVDPPPPLAGEELPHIGAGLRFMAAPTAYLEELRARHGDTFFVSVFGFPLLMTFAPRGLESLYKLPEEQASFGLATWDLVGFKTPSEIFPDVDTALFRDMLQAARMPAHLAVMDSLVLRELGRWGESGELDLFDAIRTLEQRVGFGLWIAPAAADDAFWPELKRHFDVLDQAEAFVAPERTLATISSGKSAERAALHAIGDLLPAILAAHDASPAAGSATVDLLRARFGADTPEDRARKLLHNMVNLNQGFLSNLYAAIAWVLAQLLLHPALLARLRDEADVVRARYGEDFRRSAEALNAMGFCEQVMMESVRVAQRSLTLRKALAELRFDDGRQVYTVQPGVYIATMLSVTNTQTAELRRFDPEHYRGRELRPELLQFGRESVSTFGHGRHACPAQRFSLHMCRIVVSRILERFELQPLFDSARPAEHQLGGVSRPQDPLHLRFRRTV